MSILLEALRKSEKSQRPLAAPSIHDDSPEHSPRGPLKRGPLLILVAAGFILTGWFGWRQYRPVAVNTPAATSVQTAPGLATAGLPVETRANAGEANATPAKQPAQRLDTSPRTPVESYQQASGEAVASQTVDRQKEARGNVPVDAAPAVSTANPLQTADTPPVANRRQAGAVEKPTAGGEDEFQAGELAPIGYWELPDAIRADVPEIKFSVLVYSSNPAERFVLINGERMNRGDSLPSGPEIVEIRLDGVVFSYHLYHFLVKR